MDDLIARATKRGRLGILCDRIEALNEAYMAKARNIAQAVLDALSAGDGVQEVDRDCAWEIFSCRDSRVAETIAARHRTLAAAAERARIVAALHEDGSHEVADMIERGEV